MLIHYFKELFKDKDLIQKCCSLALPMMFQQLIISAVNLVDNLMVGQLGDIAISGVATANKYYNTLNFVIISVISSCVIFLAQFNGAENKKKMQETYRFTLTFTYAVLILGFLICELFPEQLIKFIIDDPLIVDAGTRYIKIAAISFLPLGISMVISSAMRAVGEVKLPMIVSVLSIAVNGILDYGLVLGKLGLPRLEIEGAAIATIIARIVEAVLLMIVVRKQDYDFETKLKDIFKFDLNLAKNILIKAIPLVLNEIAWNLGMVTLMKCYSSRGQIVNTGYSVCITVSDLFFALFSGMATASSVLIGTPLGAGKLIEAKENGYKLICFSLFMSLFFGAGLFLSSYVVGFIYNNLTIEALNLSSSFLKTMGILYWIYMFDTQCYFTLRSGGDTKSAMLIDCTFMWLVTIPVVSLLAYKTDLPIIYVYIAGQLTDIVKGAFAFYIVKKETWVKNLTTQID